MGEGAISCEGLRIRMDRLDDIVLKEVTGRCWIPPGCTSFSMLMSGRIANAQPSSANKSPGCGRITRKPKLPSRTY
jgi:hypothetical protein